LEKGDGWVRHVTSTAKQTLTPPLVVFAGGGTGGHLYPAIAIAEELRKRAPGARCAFYGTRRRVEDRILGQADCEIVRQDLTPLSLLPWRWPRVWSDYRAARRECRSRFAKNAPSFVVGTGGLASVPAVHEAARAGIPSAILNPDALPGRANWHLASAVDLVFVQWPEAKKRIQRRALVLVCGCPVRSDFNTADRTQGLARFGLDERRRTLLVTGASQGARSINEAVIANGKFLAALADWQILHLAGERDFDEVKAAYERCGAAAVVEAYTDHMADALAVSDLVISRAGASTLAEITALGRPSILMPYPYHRDQHQRANAECLARAGAAQIVLDRIKPEENGPTLRRVLEELMSDDDLRSSMASAARNMGRPDAARAISEHILRLTGWSQGAD
jgi:UDP-N-acetylglucosamine--N-acetylmuramyl-(pentapeptide) pyrophosphoryl-undecaprenol N-acetylglucosamine transferase